jgi:hypothetical protein
VLDTVKINSVSGNDGRFFGGVFVQYATKKRLSIRYELNMYQDYSTTTITTKKDGNDLKTMLTTGFFALNNHFSANYYLHKRLYGMGGMAIQFNKTNHTTKNDPNSNTQLAPILGVVSREIEISPVVLGGIVGLGIDIGRFNFQLRYQHNFTNFNKFNINVVEKEYKVKDQSGNIFFSTGITLFKKSSE